MALGWRLVRGLGSLMMLGGVVLIVLLSAGVLDTWLAENWSCASGGSPGIARERQCNWGEAKWSALVLSGTLFILGFVVHVIPAMKGKDPEPKQANPVVIDLSWIGRFFGRR